MAGIKGFWRPRIELWLLIKNSGKVRGGKGLWKGTADKAKLIWSASMICHINFSLRNPIPHFSYWHTLLHCFQIKHLLICCEQVVHKWGSLSGCTVFFLTLWGRANGLEYSCWHMGTISHLPMTGDWKHSAPPTVVLFHNLFFYTLTKLSMIGYLPEWPKSRLKIKIARLH